MKMNRLIHCAAALLAGSASVAWAGSMKLANIFGDHMVIQADKPPIVWGTAAAGATIRVQIANQSQRVTADAQGRFRAEFDPIHSGGPWQMSVACGDEKRVVSDVLVGEVWLGSGQSNMEHTFGQFPTLADEAAKLDLPSVRFFTVTRASATQPASDVTGTWKTCTPENVKEFSATATFFARDLSKELNVPVGMIVSSYGAAGGEAFISREALLGDPITAEMVAKGDERLKQLPAAKEDLEKRHRAWEQTMRGNGRADLLATPRTAAESKKIGEPLPTAIFNDQQYPSLLYNAMIAPLVGVPVRGVLWYQGEHNAKYASSYRLILNELINDWRQRWREPQLPFLLVQLPNWGKKTDQPQESDWAELREQQAAICSVPGTAVAVTIDVGDVDIHPPNKAPVGRRLALLALKHVYGRDVIADSPMFKSARREGSKFIIEFDTPSPGLSVKGDPLMGFTIAGADHTFVRANAKVTSPTTVEVWADSIGDPAAVRYAWAQSPECNLYGPNDLPAMPFRTDNWPRSKAMPISHE